MKKKSHTHRDGDQMVTVTVELQSATVDFAEILEAVRIEVDEDYDPLKDQDTYTHELVELPDVDPDIDVKEIQAAVWVGRGSYRSKSGWRLIQLAWDPLAPGECGAHGMSKQVRYEFAAGVKARLLDTIKTIYAGEFRAYGVVGDFRGFHASVWGVDDEEFADTDVRQEIASEIAHDMVKADYTVTGYPPVETFEEKRRRIRDKVRRNLSPTLSTET